MITALATETFLGGLANQAVRTQEEKKPGGGPTPGMARFGHKPDAPLWDNSVHIATTRATRKRWDGRNVRHLI